MLETGATAAVIASYLEREFDEHFGMPGVAAGEFAASVSTWYRKRWQGTVV
jgi:hypothetical protein